VTYGREREKITNAWERPLKTQESRAQGTRAVPKFVQESLSSRQSVFVVTEVHNTLVNLDAHLEPSCNRARLTTPIYVVAADEDDGTKESCARTMPSVKRLWKACARRFWESAKEVGGSGLFAAMVNGDSRMLRFDLSQDFGRQSAFIPVQIPIRSTSLKLISSLRRS